MPRLIDSEGRWLLTAEGNRPISGTNCATECCGEDEPPTGAICMPDGSCFEGTEEEAAEAGGTYKGDGTTCDGIPPCIGAICLPNGNCFEGTREEAMAAGGTYMGDGTTCAEVECPSEPPPPNPCICTWAPGSILVVESFCSFRNYSGNRFCTEPATHFQTREMYGELALEEGPVCQCFKGFVTVNENNNGAIDSYIMFLKVWACGGAGNVTWQYVADLGGPITTPCLSPPALQCPSAGNKGIRFTCGLPSGCDDPIVTHEAGCFHFEVVVEEQCLDAASGAAPPSCKYEEFHSATVF